MSSIATCTVIICTLALAERRESLHRAIRSITGENDCPTRALVVVNGQSYDPEIVSELERRSDLDVLQIDSSGSPAAILAGRKAVRTPYFAYLDDDDEYLPGAIDHRLRVLERFPTATIAVGPGYRRIDGQDAPAILDLLAVEVDPLRALFDGNWLASCGALYRASAVPVHYFEDLPKHIHWSWIAFRLATDGHEIRTVAERTFRIHESSSSASKTSTYLLTHTEIYSRMLTMATRRDIRRIIRRRLCYAWHAASVHYVENGNLPAAWHAHLRSLARPYGLRYLTYTRKLIFRRWSRPAPNGRAT